MSKISFKFPRGHELSYPPPLSYSADAADGCGGEYTESTGTITSPNYPQPYMHDSQCVYLIRVRLGLKVRLTFSAFNVESHDYCNWDYVEVWVLTHWGRVTHICVSKLTIIGSNIGLSPERRQAIIWNNAGTLLIGPLRTNFSEISIEIQTFSLKKIRLKMSSVKCRPFCIGLNVLIHWTLRDVIEIWDFQVNLFSDWWLRYLQWNCPHMNANWPYWWYVNIGSGNGLLLSGRKPLPGPLLTPISVTVWCHWATEGGLPHCQVGDEAET